uniref:Cysteine dioxygenase n=1 Tax=Pavo cristatus TaxID=9049 RepID=A0A8C9G615_PAVCR
LRSSTLLFPRKTLLSITRFLCCSFLLQQCLHNFVFYEPISTVRKANTLYCRYTRNLVDNGNGKFNLMILCWGEGHGKDPSHGGPFTKRWPKQNMKYSIGLHRVENISHTETAVSLHLYSPPFDSCNTFDQRTGHKHKVKMTFYSQFGERTHCVSRRQHAPQQPSALSAGLGLRAALLPPHVGAVDLGPAQLRQEFLGYPCLVSA